MFPTRCLVVGIAIALLAGYAHSQPLPAFPRGVYWAWERTAPMAKAMKLDQWAYVEKQAADLSARDHVNFVWTVNIGTKDLIQLSAVCARHGITVAGTPEPVIWYRQDRSPAGVEKTARDSVAALKDAKGLGAYILIDEPTLWELDHMNNLREAFRRLDPTREVIMVTMVGMSDAARLRTGFPVITTDCYPFFTAGDPNGPNTPVSSRAYYRATCEGLARPLAREGRAFWAMPQVFAETWGPWYYDKAMNVVAQPESYAHWRQPTVGETRWQIWSAVAAGARGVIFFLLHPPTGDEFMQPSKAEPAPADLPRATKEINTGAGQALLNPDGTSTPQLAAMGEDFAALAKLEKTLAGLQPLATPLAFAEAPAHVALFRGAGGATYAVVVNDDTDHDVDARLSLLPGIKAVTEALAGADCVLTSGKDGLMAASVHLKAGDGALLRLVYEAGKEPTLAYAADFASPQNPVAATGGSLSITSRGFGVGWQYALNPTGPTQPVAPMTVDLDVKQIAGEGQGAVYLVYAASFPPGKEAVELSAMIDGKTFGRINVDEPGRPILIPANATKLRLRLLPEARLEGVRCVRAAP